MYVINYHNELTCYNPGMCMIFGPYNTIGAAKNGLVKLVNKMNDKLFKIDPDPDTAHDGTYAGYYYLTLVEHQRDEDLANKMWAEIVEMKPPIN